MNTRFAPGDRVAVRRSESPGHIRTPHYVRGRVGVVEGVYGPYPNPEEKAYGRSGTPPRPLYRVRFRQAELWAEYSGSPADCVEVEIYEHWLELA
jgi:nitrile hydratase